MKEHQLKISKYTFGRWVIECDCGWKLPRQFNANFNNAEENKKLILTAFEGHLPNEYFNNLGEKINDILNKEYPDENWTTSLVRKIIKEKFSKTTQLLLKRFDKNKLNNLWFQYEPQ